VNEDIFDRILGSLLGSAIGDALGAPVEMWSHGEIAAQHGHIDQLLPLQRPASPEGPWGDQLPPGSGTDDTRWKALMITCLTGDDPAQALPWPLTLNPAVLAQQVCTQHDRAQAGPPHEQLWLAEWEPVAAAYLAGDAARYGTALARFYGGEMTCAGMLYAPVIGVAYPAAPQQAYRQALAMAMFDQGYARDLTALTAAMTAAAMAPQPSPASILAVIDTVDPKAYAQSRLIGRSASYWYQLSQEVAAQAGQKPWSVAFDLLDQHQQRLAFHPAEIWLVMLTALQLCAFDFRTTMTFIVNYGRDNDTTAAVAGAILGAMYGATRLPDDWVQPTLTAQLALGIDLPALAGRMTITQSGQFRAGHPQEQ
jgi:hypothetical protein